ncbi:2-polyprenyl-6-methoxyphenol hydroxylase [Microbacterium testaceum StLB037]|uniref:2-polyprenyl-6-methoxyphenol hydroxylase n=1 Tax=Microbacterium testaceum (strain StLB037) TaxID=979556 RepID=E8NBX3_MICTS|nr:hypothetical protein [Microbacterium testaceum]BAJ74806.1 2-polyprenyl-6-methoxyphenol hydroxylase [Microbacterium testaceum StLB037]
MNVDAVANAVWGYMSSALLASYNGGVSIAKFLHERSEEEARRSWTGRIARELSGLPPDVRESMSFDPDTGTVRLSEGVTAEFELGDVTVSIFGGDVWKAALRPGVSAAIIAGLGWSRWGERWAEELRRLGPERGPIVDTRDGTALPWVAQRPDKPGPWTRARSEADAALIGDAESLGTPRLLAAYEAWDRR